MASDEARLNLLLGVLERNLMWVAAADSKVGPVLALDTAMLGVLAALAPSPSSWDIVQAGTGGVAVVLLLASTACVAFAVFPRLEGPKGSRIFFGGIAAQGRADYVKSMLAAQPGELLEDIAHQCHRNAEIARSKYYNLRWSMILLFASILPWLIAVALLYNSQPVTSK
jgi:hypothetical protein